MLKGMAVYQWNNLDTALIKLKGRQSLTHRSTTNKNFPKLLELENLLTVTLKITLIFSVALGIGGKKKKCPDMFLTSSLGHVYNHSVMHAGPLSKTWDGRVSLKYSCVVDRVTLSYT